MTHTYLSILEKELIFDTIYDQLSEWSEKAILGFETCHARVEGAFDDTPDDDA